MKATRFEKFEAQSSASPSLVHTRAKSPTPTFGVGRQSGPIVPSSKFSV
jgi:hypothetical protein